MSRKRADRFVADGCWREVYPCVFTDAGSPMSAVQRATAGVVACGGVLAEGLLDCESPEVLVAVACGRDAARVWGIPLIDDDDPATQALDKLHHDTAVWRELEPLRSRPVVPTDPVDVLHRHQLELSRCDVHRHPSGLWLTVPLRTLYDLTSLISHEAMVCAIDFCLHVGLLSQDDLAELLVRTKGWRHAPAFRRAVDLADGRAESAFETLTRLLLRPGWPALTPQVRVCDDTGLVLARLDLGDEEIKLGVDSDGRAFHSGELMWAKDKQRDISTEREGWKTEHVTWFQVRRQGSATRRRILAVADRRRQELRRAA